MIRAETRHIKKILTTATDADLENGREWYNVANATARQIANNTELPLYKVSGIIAVLSPSSHWEANVEDAYNVCYHYRRYGEIDGVTVRTYGQNLIKAATILDAPDDPETVDAIVFGKQGRKTFSFHRNILLDDRYLTVDGHAYCIWKGVRLPVGKVPRIGKGLYETISRAYRLVSARTENLSPMQVQATTWITYRRIHGIM